MSRLDEIKARAEAATKGPWSFDWSEGEVPVFYGQTTKISGTFSVEANTIEDAEFIAAAREDVPWLIECIGELNGAICWDTTCLNCSSLLDSNYDQYMRAEIAEAEVERLTAERDALAAQVAEGVHVTEVWVSDLATDAMVHVMDGAALESINEQLKRLLDLRDALAGSEADHDMPTENWTCPRCNRELPAQVWVCDCVPSPQSTEQEVK